MAEDLKTGFIGAGNMATALVSGLLESGACDRDMLGVFDTNQEALRRLSERFGLTCYSSNNELVQDCSTVVLCVKPQNMEEVLDGVKGDIRDDHLLISIAAGIPLGKIQTAIGRDVPLVRVMPNTPALVQKGVSALAGGALAKPEHVGKARAIFEAVGETVEVKESLMDAVTALSGSGPGFVFRIMECMVEAGVAVGLERDVSVNLVLQTVLGASHLAKESGEALARLREKVTSPGGTTAAGLAVLEEMDLEGILKRAVKAACDRSKELGS